MKLKKICIFLTATIFLLIVNVMQLKAQPGTPGSDCNNSDPDAPDIECPIDAPVVLLAAAILFLSVKKLYATQNSLK